MTVQEGRLSLRRIATTVIVAVVLSAVVVSVQPHQTDTGLLQGAVLAAKQPAAAGQAQPQFRAAVDLVRVDLYATTSDGPVLDLGQKDFEVYEDGVLQKIESFEHIVSRAPVPESERAEPRSDDDVQAAAGDPHTRLFVVLFDTLHTFGYEGPYSAGLSYDPASVGRDLTTFLHQSIGADDLVAVMRPEMSLTSLRFTRRPSRFDEFLLSGAEWQKRFVQGAPDEVERQYDVCYARQDLRDIYMGMVARRREMKLLDTLRGLSVWLGALREGRKAVFVVSEGWELYRPDQKLARPIEGRPNTPAGIRIPQMPGRPTYSSTSTDSTAMASCERDRMMLSRLDNFRDFQRMLDEANRNGVTFYPIDIRGLSVAGTMNRRGDSLISLATATDGVAVINTNSFTPVLKRISDDLASYYLLGYYSANTKADGTFRKIDVKVRRPGVSVRARRGYLAPTAEERGELAKAPPPRDPDAEARDRALRQLDAEQPRQPVRISTGFAWQAATEGAAQALPVAWVAGELDRDAPSGPESANGEVMEINVLDSTGATVAGTRVPLISSASSFVAYLSEQPLASGTDYSVRVRLEARSGGVPYSPVTARLTVAASGSLAGSPLLYRAATSARAPFVPTIQPRYRRTERIRVVLPIGPKVDSVSAQLQDRRGQPLPVPLVFTITSDGPVRVGSGEILLSPLSVGDYLVQCDAAAGSVRVRTLVAFRIVP